MKFPKYPRVLKDSFEDWNEEMFVKYNNERVYNHPNLIIRFVEKKRVEAILRYLYPVKKTDYILAAGCGEGYIEKQIKGGTILLVDLSQSALKRAKLVIGKQKNRKYLRANLEKLPLKGKLFDKIECSEVIEHVYSPEKLLKEFHRVSTDTGKLIISFPNEPLINKLKKMLIAIGVFNLFFPNIPKDMLEEWHLRAMDLRVFKKFARRHWNIVSVSPVPSRLLPIRYVVLADKKL
jgi:ubiquinone/menaquinone biosynthesis C-methylase UbiE